MASRRRTLLVSLLVSSLAAVVLPCVRARAAPMVLGGPIDEVHVLVAPKVPRAGEPVRVLVGRLGDLGGSRIVIEGADGPIQPERLLGGEGPTAILAAWTPPVTAGPLTVRVLDAGGRELASASTTVVAADAPRPSPYARTDADLWPIEAEWDARHETLFSAWIATMFHVVPGAHASWNPLHQATRDQARNVLYDYLALGEDSGRRGRRLMLLTDCADTLYALRAYFAWKMRLPFLAQWCSRGTARDGPTCRTTVTNQRSAGRWGRDEVIRFMRFVSWLGQTVVHAGTARTLPDDPESDFYPVALERASLRPGTVYVDAAGHVLMVSQWASPAPGRFGALYAIDGHPDTSVTHKRFTQSWFGFLPVTTDGFKAFRPPIVDRGVVRPMTDDEIRVRPWLPPPSLEQAAMSPERFYARMAAIQNPVALDVRDAIRGAVTRLHRAVVMRADAVRALPPERWQTIPERPFSGIGADPAWHRIDPMRRELEMLVAIEEARLLAWRVTHEPGLVRGQHDVDAVRVAMAAALRAERVSYRRSDGSEIELRLDAIVEREIPLTYGFHPGDCPEARWGARGDERATCRTRVELASQRTLRRVLTEVMRRRMDPSGL
ncbi:MAG: hypothetical protein IT379_38270 [Deltaproteobacteria bacterium]|nr:hypothetical protein [Deltaproteobacteria bacterium]